jgi:hypothetical protein
MHAPNRARLGVLLSKALRGAADEGPLSPRLFVTCGSRKKSTMSKSWNKFIVVTLLGIGSYFALNGCQRNDDHDQDEARNAAKKHELDTLHAFAIKSGAIEGWETPFTNQFSGSTIDVQDTFLNKSAPFEFTGELVDVYREKGHIMALFTVDSAISFTISLRVICSEAQRKVLTQNPGLYAIIANVQELSKPGTFMAVNPADEEQTFDIDLHTTTYWLFGRCIDVQELK